MDAQAQPVETIMLLYVESERYGKQVFVAFDKHLSYTAANQAKVESHTVIELGEGTASLYGWVWNTKDERARNEDQLQRALETVDRQRDEQDPAPDQGKDLAIDHGEARARRQRTD